MKVGRLQLLIVFMLSLVVSGLLYTYSSQGFFIRDDKLYSYRQDLHQAKSLISAWKQPYIQDSPSVGVYRPLTIATFALNFTVFGKSTFSFHIFNIVINGINTFLLWLVLLALFKNRSLAYIGAAIFAFMPIHTEAVAFIKSRDELLATMFGLLAWLAFIKGTSKKHGWLSYKWIFASGLLFILSVLSKETFFSIPAVFIATYWVMQKPKFKKLIKPGIIFSATGLAYLIARFLVLHKYAFGSDTASFVIDPLGFVNLPTRVFTAFKIAFLLFSKTIVPWGLTATYNFNHIKLVGNLLTDWQALAGLGMLIGLTWLAFTRRKGWEVARIGAISLLIPYLMVSKLVFGGGEITGERWMYFPSIGFVIIMAFLITKLLSKHFPAGAVALALVLIPYGFMTVNRNLAWINERVLGESEVKASPDSAVGYLTLSDWYFDLHDFDSAKQELLKAYEISPTYTNTLDALGRIAYLEGDFSATANYLTESVNNGGKSIGIYFGFAQSLAQLRRFDESLKLATAIAARYPNHPDVEFVIALDYYKLGRIDEAKKHFDWKRRVNIVGQKENLTEQQKIDLLEALK